MCLSVALWLVSLSVHLFKDASVSQVILLQRGLGCVLSEKDGISMHGLTLSRSLELGAQWGAVLAADPVVPLAALISLSPLLLAFHFFVLSCLGYV